VQTTYNMVQEEHFCTSMGSWGMCSADTNTVWSEWQVQLQHREYNDNAFWHAREQQTYQYVSYVSNIYIPE